MRHLRGLAVVVLALLLATISAIPASADTVTVSDIANLQAAIDGAGGVRTIEIVAGVHVLGIPNILINKSDITIQGQGTLGTKIQVSGTGSRFYITSPGCTIRNLEIEKTDKAVMQGIIYVGAQNVTIQDNKIHGQFVLGDPQTDRALEVAYGTANLQILGNEIYGLRQPGYLNGSLASPTTGTIATNFVHGTKGWVLAGANMAYSGNTWGTGANANYYDIVILSMTDASYYLDIVAVSNANAAAVVEDQRLVPAVLSIVTVNAAALTVGTGSPLDPYQTITSAVTRVVAGGTIGVANGIYPEAVSVIKSLRLIGSGQSTTTITQGLAITAPVASPGSVRLQDLSVLATTSVYNVDTYYAVRIDATTASTAPIVLERVTLRSPNINAVYGAGLLITPNNNTVNDVQVLFCTVNDSYSHGLYIRNDIGTTGLVSNLVLSHSSFDNNTLKGGTSFYGYGLYTSAPNATPSLMVDGVTVTDCTFNDNYRKGLFIETLQHASFDSVTSTGNGQEGVDLNLKFGNYDGFTFTNCTFTGNNALLIAGTPDVHVKGRNDGGTYSLNPASVTGVSVANSTVGIASVGNNVLATGDVEIHHSTIGGVVNYTTTGCLVDAIGNYWGTVVKSEIAARTNGLVGFTPWCNVDFSVCNFGLPVHNVTKMTDYLTITAALADANLVGDLIQVDAGIYPESNILVDKSITIEGVGTTRDDVVVVPAAEDVNADNAFVSAQNGFVIKAHGVTIRNLTLNGRGNLALTPNKNNFRAGIVTLDASQSGGGAWNNLHVDNVFVKHAYRRGISVFPTTVSGTVIENSRVDSTAFNHGMYLAGQSQAVNNTVKHCFQGIVQALDTTTPAGLIKATGNTLAQIGNFPGCWGDQGAGVYSGQPRAIQFNNSDGTGRQVEISGNIIDDLGSAGLGGTVGIYTRLANAASIVDNNTITMTSGASWAVDGGSQSVGMLLGWSYANGFTVTNNHVNSFGYGMGVMVFGAGTFAMPMVLEDNTITGNSSTRATQGDGTGIYIANQYLYASDMNESCVIIRNGNAISGFVRGIDVEKVDTSTQPLTVTVNGNSIAGNATGLDASTMSAPVDASGNWWGAGTPAGVAAQVSINVDYTPWLAVGTEDPVHGGDAGFQGDFSTLWVDDNSPQAGAVGRIQEGVNLVSGSTVNVAAGLYLERVLVDRPMSLLGATAGINKNGYVVPTNYAWNTAVESVISNPAPEPTADISVVDMAADNIVFKGFVVQSLNAPVASANDQLLRINAQGFLRNGLVIQNNIIGPNTNAVSQVGTNGRMGLYFASPNYSPGGCGVTNTLVSGNKIFDCRGNGDNVFIWGAAASYVSPGNASYVGTVIEDNEIYGSHRSGIEIAGGVTGLTIRNNVIYGNSSTVNGAVADPSLKWGNGIAVIRMGSDKGVCSAPACDQLTITGNRIRDNEKCGVYFGPANSNHAVNNNVFANNGWDGVRVDLTELYYGGTATSCFNVANNISMQHNSIVGTHGASIVGTPTNGFQLAALENWWGDAGGPKDVGTADGFNNPTGLGSEVTDWVSFDPWIGKTGTGNIVCNPDEVAISLADAGANDLTMVKYLGGLSGPLYGFDLRVQVDPAYASYVSIVKPTSGPFASAVLFQVVTPSVGVREVHAALGGANPGTLLSCDLFKVTFHGVGCTPPAGTPIALSVLGLRDGSNTPLTGGVADPGVLKVDLGVPTITVASLLRTAGGPTNPLSGYAKNTDTVTLTATIGDGACSGVSVAGLTADLTFLGGLAAVAPSSYDTGTGVATWTLAVNVTPPSLGTDGTKTVAITAVDGLGNAATLSPAGSIIVDNTKPAAPTSFTAAPGFHEVTLGWTNPTPVGDPNLTLYGVKVRRAEWNDYPAYATAAPAYPATETAGASAVDQQPAQALFVDDFANTTADRDICYYRAFVYDAAGNYSAAGTLDTARATNYWLGDVRSLVAPPPPYDGTVDMLSDITALGLSYYKFVGDAGYDAECNVGPTVGGSRVGIPLPQTTPVGVDFEDLMIFAMNYGVVTSLTGGILGDVSGIQVDPGLQMQIEVTSASELRAHLVLAANRASVKGVHSVVGFDAGMLELVSVSKGALTDYPGVFFKDARFDAGVAVDAAILGEGYAFDGSGEVAVLTFRVLSAGARPELLVSDLRDIHNISTNPTDDDGTTPPPVTTDVPPAVPANLALLGARPNPFVGSTEIRFALPEVSVVSVRIFNVNGRLVRTLVDGMRPAGEHAARWDGRMDSGLQAGAGVYFYTFQSGRVSESRKLYLAR